jgi:hypothetical protein
MKKEQSSERNLPTGAMAPLSFSKDLRAVEEATLETGAKAEAAATRRTETARANFMIEYSFHT